MYLSGFCFFPKRNYQTSKHDFRSYCRPASKISFRKLKAQNKILLTKEKVCVSYFSDTSGSVGVSPGLLAITECVSFLSPVTPGAHCPPHKRGNDRAQHVSDAGHPPTSLIPPSSPFLHYGFHLFCHLSPLNDHLLSSSGFFLFWSNLTPPVRDCLVPKGPEHLRFRHTGSGGFGGTSPMHGAA